jgi:RNA polymerase sigma-70 factor, ECF subfamily
MPTAVAGTADASVVMRAGAEDCSDKALIARIAGRDQPAMCALFARYRTPLYRWLLRIVGDKALAEDLLSEVFIDVWRQASSFMGRSSVSTWLLAIARYKALSARRRRREEQLDMELAESICDPAGDPETVLQKKDQGERLAQALSKLPEDHRQVIDLVYYHGRAVREVSEILRIPESTVKTRMFYARKKLARLVDRDGGELSGIPTLRHVTDYV